MKFIVKTFLVYLFITVQTLFPIAREFSYLPQITPPSVAYAVDCEKEDADCLTFDLTKGEYGEEGEEDSIENQSGNEGLVGGAELRHITMLSLGDWFIKCFLCNKVLYAKQSCGWSQG